MAQQSSDNPIVVAEDAFGVSLRSQSVGIYNVNEIRGFSPQVAGNVRIDGLYFDLQGVLSEHIVDRSTVRIGISQAGYAFPAPTGIADYSLKSGVEDRSTATMIAEAGPFESLGISADASLSTRFKGLRLPMGMSYEVSADCPGCTSTIASVGAAPVWHVSDRLYFRAFLDWRKTYAAKQSPLVFTADGDLPPEIPSKYLGQKWAENESVTENLGAILNANLNNALTLEVGIFRSLSKQPLSFSDLYMNTQHDGLSRHLMVATANQRSASTSGEIRLSMTSIFSNKLQNNFILSARGRDVMARYGGSDVVDFGQALIDEGIQLPRPIFSYSEQTTEQTELWSLGASYSSRWHGLGELTVGIQRQQYEKNVVLPDALENRLAQRPWRKYAALSFRISHSLAFYSGYTEGLEDSGVAPNEAENRGFILPAAETWQVDGGLYYLLTSNLKLISGVYQLSKPYFNFDAGNSYRQLGTQRARGLEFSISGDLSRNLKIVAGGVFGSVEVSGSELQTEKMGPIALGQPRIRAVLSADYQFVRWPFLSVDLNVDYFGTSPSTLDNRIYIPSTTLLNVGARYRFSILSAPATLRATVFNVTDVDVWTIMHTPGYFRFPSPTAARVQLTVDL